MNEGGRLFEDRGARSVTVTASLDGTLRLAPTAVLVTVAGGSAASTDFAASPSTFTLTVPAHSTEPDAPVTASLTLTLTPVADDIDEDDETVIVSGTTEATVENSTDLLQVESDTMEILDDDTRRVAVSAPSVSVEEGGTGSYTVVLESAPTETVTVTLTTSGDVDDLEIGPATLEFNADNWSVAKTVEIQSIADFDAVDEVVTVTHAVTGGDYGSNRVTADPVTVTVTDNDERGLELAPPEVDRLRRRAERDLYGGSQDAADGNGDDTARGGRQPGRDGGAVEPDVHQVELRRAADGDGRGPRGRQRSR